MNIVFMRAKYKMSNEGGAFNKHKTLDEHTINHV